MELDLSRLQPPPATVDVSDGTAATFEQVVIRASHEKPVVVDFWAPWCGPCKQLMPLLEKHARAAGGKVALVKINIDQEPDLAQALRIQSVPTVYAFWQGKPVDGFAGMQGEAAIKAFFGRLAKLAGKGQAEELALAIEAGRQALADNRIEEAMAAFMAVLDADAANVTAKAGLARCLVASGDTAAAREMLDDLGDEAAKNPDALAARAALDILSAPTADTAALTALEGEITANPKNFQARLDLARALGALGRMEEAIDHLLDLYRLDRRWNDEAARRQLLVFFESLGPGHPLAVSGRRRLSSLMFA